MSCFSDYFIYVHFYCCQEEDEGTVGVGSSLRPSEEIKCEYIICDVDVDVDKYVDKDVDT